MKFNSYIKLIVQSGMLFAAIFLLIEKSKGQTDTNFVNLIYSQPDKEILKKHNFQHALDQVRKAANVWHEKGDWDKYFFTVKALYFIGSNEGDLTKVLDPIEQLEKKVPGTEKLTKAKIQHLIAFILDATGNIHQSQFYLKTVLPVYLNLKDYNNAAKVFNTLANINIKLRDYPMAQYYAEKCISYNNYLDTQGKSFSHFTHGLALLFDGKTQKARKSLGEGNSILPKTDGYYEYRISESYEMEGCIDSAMIFAKLALDVAKKNKSGFEVYANKQLGSLFLSLDNFEKASLYLYRSLNQLDEVMDKREVVKVLLILSRLERRMMNPDKALIHINKGISLIGPKTASQSIKGVKEKIVTFADLYYSDLMLQKMYCYEFKYNNEKNKKYLLHISQMSDSCLTFIDDMKVFYETAEAKKKLASDSKRIFEFALTNELELYKATSKKQYLEKAFLIAQKYNSFQLREQLNEQKALEISVKDINLIQRYQKLKARYLDIADREMDGKSIEQYIEARLNFLQYRDSLGRRFPQFNNIRKKADILSLTEVRKYLPEEGMMISYFSGLEKAYVFYITKTELKTASFLLDENYKRQASAYFSILSMTNDQDTDIGKTESTFLKASHFLYTTLLKNMPVKGSIKKLWIVPDGHLYRIPFEALISTPELGWKNKNSYLLNQYTISYLYYVGQLAFKNGATDSNGFLGIGLEYDDATLKAMEAYKSEEIPDWLSQKFRAGSMTKLYHADDEVMALSQVFNGTTLLNKKATKRAFMQLAPQHDILHISAHSFNDFEHPEKSGISFTKISTDPDFVLGINDILGMPLSCQLVTLSSCSSASGLIQEGEGVASLSKAFFEAGSSSVLGSNWSVSDEISRYFMEDLAQRMADGLPKDEALRQSKLALIDGLNGKISPAFRLPGFWSSWVLYGDIHPVKKHFPSWIWISILCVLILASVTYYQFKTRSLSKA